jgi:hypothetical protein
MHKYAMFPLSRRLPSALFLTSAATAAWAGCCDGDASGRTTSGDAIACPSVGAAPATSEAPVDTHSRAPTASDVVDRGSRP